MCRGWGDEPCPRGWDQQEQGSACGHWVSCFSRDCDRIRDINSLRKEGFILIQFEDAAIMGRKGQWQEAEGVQEGAQLETSFVKFRTSAHGMGTTHVQNGPSPLS